MDLLIKNGTIVTAKESYKADVAVNDGKIVAIGSNLDFDADKVVDAGESLFSPVQLMCTLILQCRSAARFLPTATLQAQERRPAAV